MPDCLAAFAAAGMRPQRQQRGTAAAGAPARLVLLRGIKGGRAGFRLLPGLVLHARGGGYTAEAEAVLRDGAGLGWD